MNVSLNKTLSDFVRDKIRSGQFASEEAVVDAALERFRDQEAPPLEGLIDHEFVDFCSREGDDSVALEEVVRATSKIPGSMARAIIEDERADRI
jgi:Arc/MetJ-type ribon-helix-helix transcriptional regulator